MSCCEGQHYTRSRLWRKGFLTGPFCCRDRRRTTVSEWPFLKLVAPSQGRNRHIDNKIRSRMDLQICLQRPLVGRNRTKEEPWGSSFSSSLSHAAFNFAVFCCSEVSQVQPCRVFWLWGRPRIIAGGVIGAWAGCFRGVGGMWAASGNRLDAIGAQDRVRAATASWRSSCSCRRVSARPRPRVGWRRSPRARCC